MSLIDTLLEAARFIELQEQRLAKEEPKSAVCVRAVTALPAAAPRVNGVVRVASPPPPPPPVVEPPPAPLLVPTTAPAPAPAPLLDFTQEHSRPRTSSNSHGNTQIPSPPSVGSNGSSSSSGGIPRAGTREVHNKLEKNRRAHLKECFELLKRQLPATPDDKKTSNLSILGSAIRYIQVLRRKERECEHEMERLAREKIAAQQKLAALKRDVSIRATVRPCSVDPAVADDKDRNEIRNGQVLGIPISITATSPPRMDASSSPPRSLNLSTKLRTLPIQITPTTSQVVRTSYARHNTLTLTTLAAADSTNQNGVTLENGVNNTIGTLVHPAQIHLPISQMVVGGALQLVGTGLRVLPAHNGIATENRIPKENGLVSPPTTAPGEDFYREGVVVSQLPLVVSQPSHLLHTHAFTHKMVESQMVKSGVSPITVSAQYLSTIVKPVVVVSAPSPHPHT